MKILHTVQSYLPARHGMSEVVRQISERLVAEGNQVTVATSKDIDRTEKTIAGVEVIEFDVSGSITDGIQGEYDHYIQFLLESDFDIVTNFSAQQWATDLALPILNRIRGKKVFVPTGYSGLYLPQYYSYFERMKVWLKEYDRVVYLSNDYRDVNFAREAGLTNGILIPNGASEEEFSTEPQKDIREQLKIPKENLLILHISGYVGGKGHLDSLRIFNKSGIKNATLLFVSPDFGEKFKFEFRDLNNFIKDYTRSIAFHRPASEFNQLKFINYLAGGKKLNNRQIIFTSLSRSDVILAYKSADLFLFPSHIECSPIVLFECMASTTPFLTTDVGNAKEIIEWTGAGQILPTIFLQNGYRECLADIESSSKMLRSFCNDRDKMQSMGEAGYRTWIKKYTWAIISDQYKNLYQELIK